MQNVIEHIRTEMETILYSDVYQVICAPQSVLQKDVYSIEEFRWKKQSD